MIHASTFLHLSAAWWEAVGTWIAAFGTVGAVWAALLIAARDDAVRIKVGVTVGQIAGDPQIPLERLHLWVTVTNLGRRPFMLQGVGWKSGLMLHRWGWRGRIYAVQNVSAANGLTLPMKMQDGDVANWTVPLDEWLDKSVAKLVAKPHWLGLRTLRILAYASTGDTANGRVSRSLNEKIREKLKSLR